VSPSKNKEKRMDSHRVSHYQPPGEMTLDRDQSSHKHKLLEKIEKKKEGRSPLRRSRKKIYEEREDERENRQGGWDLLSPARELWR